MAIETRFQAAFRKKVQEQIDSRSDFLTEGSARDFADYKDNCGYINGLRDSLKLLDDTETEIAGDR